jgi:hypothetical protein
MIFFYTPPAHPIRNKKRSNLRYFQPLPYPSPESSGEGRKEKIGIKYLRPNYPHPRPKLPDGNFR